MLICRVSNFGIAIEHQERVSIKGLFTKEQYCFESDTCPTFASMKVLYVIEYYVEYIMTNVKLGNEALVFECIIQSSASQIVLNFNNDVET